ncbi:MAG: hypothetical protein VX793_10005 [Pseudomonadota bacterium]|nr:hypothetical protein [Pseudomonadota bacterium]
MLYAYKYILVLAMIAFPYLMLVYRNKFDRPLVTGLRFVMAVFVVWAWLLFCRFVVDFVDVRLVKTPEELREIYSGDGAKNAAVIMYGWVVGLFLACLSWLVARLRLYFHRKRGASVT